MKKTIFIICVFLALLVPLFTGCKSVKLRVQRDDVRTGMFGNNRSNLVSQFFAIRRGVTTTADLEKLGFDLKAKNVKVTAGICAFREVFGPDVFRDSDYNKLTEAIKELNLYTLYEIPYKEITVVSDRLYWSRKTTTEQGHDDMYTIVTKSDVVIYAAPRQVYKDTSRLDKAFARGLIEILGEFGGVVKAAEVGLP